MPARQEIPPLRYHSTSGRYYVWHSNKRHTMGRTKPEAEARHREFVRGLITGEPERPAGGLLIVEALGRYRREAIPKMEPRLKHRATKAIDSIAMNFPALPVEFLRFAHLEQIVQQWCESPGKRGPLSANYIRALLSSIRQAWKWLALRDLVTAESCGKVTLAVQSIKIPAQVIPPAVPVTAEQFQKTMAECDLVTRDMATIQLLTGMRTGELLRLSAAEIDRTKSVWVYTPKQHKNAWRGKGRRIYLDSECQRILEPYLDASPCFPMSLYAYSKRIQRAAAKAGVPHWRPYLCRHARATEAAIDAGDEAAILVLGHSSRRLLGTYTHTAEDERRRRAG